MSNEPAATGARKRQQIDSTNKQVMIYVAIAATVVAICAMLVINFYQRISYQLRVNGEWSLTNKSLEDSIKSIPKLREEIEGLEGNSVVQSIIGKMADPDIEKWKVVFDILPSSCDPLAVEYAITEIIIKEAGVGAGVKDATATLEGLSCTALSSGETAESSGAASSASSAGSTKPNPVLMKINFELTNATDEDIRKVLQALEYSLHQIVVGSIDITSDESGLRSAKVSAQTYFMPKADWQAGSKTVPISEDAKTNKGKSEETAK